MYILKTILLGDGLVGKTSLVQRYVNNVFHHSYKQTVGIDFTSKEFNILDTHVKLVINDIGGQEAFKKIRSAYYAKSQLVFLVCDVTRSSTLSSLENDWLPEVVKANPHEKGHLPLQGILIANKVDLEVLRQITAKDLSQAYARFCQVPGIQMCGTIETSAKENLNVETAFLRLTEGYITNLEDLFHM